MYDLARDPEEQRNLAADPAHAARLVELRGEIDRWMRAQGDRGAVFGAPRLLSDPNSYGPSGPPGNAAAKGKAGKKTK